jgi:hypothetical protein
MTSIYACINQGILYITQGCDYQDTVSLTQLDGSPYDLTGCTATGLVRDLTGGLAATFTCSIPNPTAGDIDIDFLAAQTALLTVASSVSNVWGIRITDPSGRRLPELQGGIMVTAGVVQ